MDSSFNQELEKLLNLEMVDFPFRASFHDRYTHFKPILHQDKSFIWTFLQHESCSSCSKLSIDIKFAPFGLELRKLCLVKVRHFLGHLEKFLSPKSSKFVKTSWPFFLHFKELFKNTFFTTIVPFHVLFHILLESSHLDPWFKRYIHLKWAPWLDFLGRFWAWWPNQIF